MNALSDASSLQSAIDTRTGQGSSVASDLKNAQIGESVEYARDPMKHWFVLRVKYGKIQTARELLENRHIHHYLPLRYEVRKDSDTQRYQKKLFFPSLIFVYVEPEVLDKLIKNRKDNDVLTYYYNHFAVDSQGKNPPLVIPGPMMDNFIRLTSIEDEHVRMVDPQACHYKRGDMVIITKGKFKGIIGRLARVSQEQRVVINLEGVGMIATAYIPTAFIEPFDEDWERTD